MASTLQHRPGLLGTGGHAMRSLRRLSRYVSIAVLAVILLIGAGFAISQTDWFKNWLRQKVVSQAGQYLNGTLTIERLSGSLFTGVELEGVTLRHDGQTAVAMDKLTVAYSPLTMISKGLILDTLTLDKPTILLQRDNAGWNFNRFVKTRKNTGGRGAPPLTMDAVTINNGHVIVKDRGRVLEDLLGVNTRFRFAYLKPGIQVLVGELTAASEDLTIRALAGDLEFDRGAVEVRDLRMETDRSKLATTITYAGSEERTLDIDLHADRLSLPEVGRYFKPLAGIKLEPAIDVKGHGTLDALKMDVKVVSSTGNASGPLVGHFGAAPGLEGALAVQHVDMQPILNRREWKTDITGRAEFVWKFASSTAKPTRPMTVNFKFAGPYVEGLGYRAANVSAQGVYEPALLRFDAKGAAYGATATTRATFRFATPGRPLAYNLAGTFQKLDMRRLPAKLSMPALDTLAAGEYQFEASGRNWRATGKLQDSIVEGAHFASGTVLSMESENRRLSYSGTGNVTGLNPQRFAGPLRVTWLDDERLSGSLTGFFTVEGSGRTVDELDIHTTASLTDSTLAGADFPHAAVDFQMANRHMRATFAGPYARLPGSLLTTRPELADTMLNGSADMGVALTIPKVGPVELESVSGTTTLTSSSIAGMAIDNGQVSGTFANRTADIKQLVLTGPNVAATALGTLALAETGESNLQYDVAVLNLEPLAKRFKWPFAGSAHVVGQAQGPASRLVIGGTLGANRLRYSTNVDALTVNSKYEVALPNFDFEQARIQADTMATFVTVAGTHLPRVTANTIYEKNQLQFDSRFEEERRTLGAGGSIVFHPDHNEMHLRALNLIVGEMEWSLAAGHDATARYSKDAITLNDFVLQRGTQQLTAEGTVAVGSGSSSLANNLNLRLDNVQVQDINELLLGDRMLAGILNASAQIAGTRSDPRVQADFALTNGAVEGVKFNSLAGKANYAGRAVDVDVRLEQTPAAVLTAIGTAPVPNGPGSSTRTEEFDLAVKSTPIDIGLFQAATTQVTKLSGQMQADVHVGGTIEAPRLNGLIETSNAAFSVPATGVSYTDARARLLFDGDRLLVDRFEVSDDAQDRLVAIGELGIIRRSLSEMNVQVSAAKFKVLDNQFGNVEIEADLRVTGDAAKPQITGELSSSGDGRLEVDRLLDELARSPYSTRATVATVAETPGTVESPTAVEETATPSLYNAATVDIRVRLPDNLALRGRDMHASFSRIGLGDMNITVGGDLQIRKPPAGEPDLIGTVTVVRGFYDFQGRRFEVLRDSQIRFQGAKPIDPALQVDAQREISGVTAIVNIRGTARQPQVRLSSSPPLDEADVLSLIVFNQPINQLGEGERLNLAERAGGLAVGYLASPLANSIADALDLDIFEIQASGGINGQPSVALGQQFGSRLFVSFRQEFGSADRTELSFEYRINELLRLVSTVAQGARQTHRTQRIDTTGLDLIYVLTY